MKPLIIIQQEFGYFPKEFNTIEEMCEYHLSKKDSSHYELIEGDQCLYFDFDGKGDEEIDLIAIVDRIYSRLSYYKANNGFAILIYSSSDTIKQSFHIVVRGFHFDYLTCGSLAKEIMRKDIAYVSCFDSSVYSSKRNFRMLGSRKRDGTRVKQFHSMYNYGYYLDRSEVKNTLLESMITYIDYDRSIDCSINVVLPLRSPSVIDVWNTERIQVGMNLLNQVFPNVFKNNGINGNTIRLMRLKRYDCPLCNRSHDNDGGGLIYKQSSYYFFCWRNEEKTLLPLIDSNDTNDEETLDIPVVDEEEIDDFEKTVKVVLARIKTSCKWKV